MGCVKHSMMFEAQMTAISQYSMFPEERKERTKCQKGKKKEEGHLLSLNVETQLPIKSSSM